MIKVVTCFVENTKYINKYTSKLAEWITKFLGEAGCGSVVECLLHILGPQIQSLAPATTFVISRPSVNALSGVLQLCMSNRVSGPQMLQKQQRDLKGICFLLIHVYYRIT